MSDVHKPYPLSVSTSIDYKIESVDLFSITPNNQAPIMLPYKNEHTKDMIIKEETLTRNYIAEEETIVHTEEKAEDSIQLLEPHTFSTHIDILENAEEFTSKTAQTHTEVPEKEETDRVIVIHFNSINNTSNNWMFWVLLGTCMLLGFIKINYKKQLDFLFRTAFNYSFAIKSIKQNNEFSDRFSFLLSLLFAFHGGIFAFQIIQENYLLELKGLHSLGISVAIGIAILVAYSIKGILFKTIGFIFNAYNYAEEYIENVHIYNRILGIILLPIIIGIAFISPDIISNKALINIGLALIGLIFIVRIIRGIEISIRSNVSILYMFLYFCILEILPIVLLIKIAYIVISDYYIYV